MAGIEIDIKTTDHQQLYKQGVRAYVLQDYDSAVRAFSRCSELLSLEYKDDQHDKLGDVYLYYGKSLLGLSRQELEPLNENIIKNDDNDEGGDDDADNDNDDDDGGEDGENEEDSGGGGDDEKQNKIEDNDNKPSSIEGNGINVNDKKNDNSNTDDNKANEEEKEDELTDLQVAWEVLELAKKIFLKRGDVGKDSLAETLIVLGEVSLESGNFQIGIDDIRKGLNIQKELYENDNRTIAETYYKLGTALSTNQQIDESIEQFEKSLESLQLRLENLKKLNKNNDNDIKDEIKEIEDLIPEIEEKITDMKLYKLELLKNDDKPTSSSTTTTPSSSSSSSKQPNDISHLVKRKRNAEENTTNGRNDGDVEQLPAKKPAL